MIFAQVSQLSKNTTEDYFEKSKEISIADSLYTKAELGNCTPEIAQRGLFWESGENTDVGFIATKFRDTSLKILQYNITQKIDGYRTLAISFGEYCKNDSVKSFTIDLSNNALMQLTIENPSWDNYSVDVYFKLIDINGQILQYDKEILKNPSLWTRYSIGFLQLHSENTSKMPLNLTPGYTRTLSYDFKNAIGSKAFPPNTLANLYSDNSNFNFSKVKAISFLVVNSEMNENGQPYDIIEKQMNIKSFSLGITPIVTEIQTTSSYNLNKPSENVQVYNVIGNLIFEGNMEDVMMDMNTKKGLYILKQGGKSRKIFIQ
jgi:hypothetical protein